MNFIKSFDFLLKPKSDTNFHGLCERVNTDLNAVRNSLRVMPQDEIHACLNYAEQHGRMGAVTWIKAEIERRNFLLDQYSIVLSILALAVSIVGLF